MHHTPPALTHVRNGNGRDWAERGGSETERGRKKERHGKEGGAGVLGWLNLLRSEQKELGYKRRNGIANAAPQTHSVF